MLGSTDPSTSQRFFMEGLVFKVSDIAGPGAFLRCSTDHHNLLVMPAPVVFPHHTSWQVDDVDAIGRGAMDMLEDHPERHTWGLARHYAGSNFFWYLRDPAGTFSEYYSDMDCILDDCTFRARWCDEWRSGRVLVAGDAAHLMPPFAGQGMCAGIRDAENLLWKLDAVLGERAADSLLDTYGPERTQHVRYWIEFSMGLGQVICVADPEAAAQRDAGMKAAPVDPSLAPPRPIRPTSAPASPVATRRRATPPIRGGSPAPAAPAASTTSAATAGPSWPVPALWPPSMRRPASGPIRRGSGSSRSAREATSLTTTAATARGSTISRPTCSWYDPTSTSTTPAPPRTWGRRSATCAQPSRAACQSEA